MSLLLPHRLAAAAAAKSLQLCPTLCDPIDGSPPGSAVPGILQARTLEWVAISFCPTGLENAKKSHRVGLLEKQWQKEPVRGPCECESP